MVIVVVVIIINAISNTTGIFYKFIFFSISNKSKFFLECVVDMDIFLNRKEIFVIIFRKEEATESIDWLLKCNVMLILRHEIFFLRFLLKDSFWPAKMIITKKSPSSFNNFWINLQNKL